MLGNIWRNHIFRGDLEGTIFQERFGGNRRTEEVLGGTACQERFGGIRFQGRFGGDRDFSGDVRWEWVDL